MKLADLDLEVEVSKLRLEPGDIVVLTTDAVLHMDLARQLRERWREAVSPEHKVAVLTAGLKVSALTRAELEALTD